MLADWGYLSSHLFTVAPRAGAPQGTPFPLNIRGQPIQGSLQGPRLGNKCWVSQRCAPLAGSSVQTRYQDALSKPASALSPGRAGSVGGRQPSPMSTQTRTLHVVCFAMKEIVCVQPISHCWGMNDPSRPLHRRRPAHPQSVPAKHLTGTRL